MKSIGHFETKSLIPNSYFDIFYLLNKTWCEKAGSCMVWLSCVSLFTRKDRPDWKTSCWNGWGCAYSLASPLPVPSSSSPSCSLLLARACWNTLQTELLRPCSQPFGISSERCPTLLFSTCASPVITRMWSLSRWNLIHFLCWNCIKARRVFTCLCILIFFSEPIYVSSLNFVGWWPLLSFKLSYHYLWPWINISETEMFEKKKVNFVLL